MAGTRQSEETRRSLLLEVSKGNSDSWAEFVALYQPLLYGYVLGQGLPRHEAGDVVQDIFIKLFKTLPRFELDHQRGRFRTWLWQVAHTTVIDWARRRKRQARSEKAVRERLSGATPAPEPATDPEWDRAYQQRLMDHVLAQVREATQPKTWACFELHLLEGRPSAAVAAELGLTANSVNVNASRVLTRVRRLCDYYREELGED
jgi:RNA polymerase sigma-70 factor (ECF subfamily)